MNVYLGEILDSPESSNGDILNQLYTEEALEALPISTAHRKIFNCI
jgi:hypothetical protein